MKFECEKNLLASAIEGVSRAITNRSAIPVLEGIYLKAEGFNLILTGYDMEMGITTTIECNVLVPGETVLEAKLLLSMVSRMPAGDVRIELTDEGQAIISGGVAEFEIPAMNASDYPSLPVTGADNTMTIPTSMMRELIEKTIYAVSQDDKKPAHTGELFVIEPGSLTIVALDGYRLAIIQRDVECTRDIRIIIPAKTLQELLKIMGGPEDPVKIDANRRYVVFTTNGYTIMSRLIEGDFLNYESVIPKEKRTRVTVDCKTFINTIERASLIITERLKNPLRISFAEDKITVRCQTPLGKVVDEFAPVAMTGDPVEIGFNNRYLLDAMRYSKCERMVLEINGPLSPVKILPEDGKDFIYLVLPVRFKNEG
ncbi:DNA polymerase III subunit beta [uncultured Subdoligranulum sp.]|uniref:DNA polymerase III subunit beta n=1 Tax=uncultured Subdoligranulum sp. TaxID=512298 RepID=UPI0025DEB887|nr:DNA polymerase III subunit beta [uncultured Subdoligranulum sp.]